MMMGIFRLLNDHSNFKTRKKNIDLTLDILTYWEEVHYEKTNYFEKSDIKAFKDMDTNLLNSKIAYLEKNNYIQTNQWSMGHYNFSPNNNPFPPQEDLSGLSKEEKYEKMMNQTLDNIHCW